MNETYLVPSQLIPIISTMIDQKQKLSDDTQVDESKSRRRTGRRTFDWNEIPAWQRDNEYILTGYRGYEVLPKNI